MQNQVKPARYFKDIIQMLEYLEISSKGKTGRDNRNSTYMQGMQQHKLSIMTSSVNSQATIFMNTPEEVSA